jgi:hypothetical protein
MGKKQNLQVRVLTRETTLDLYVDEGLRIIGERL